MPVPMPMHRQGLPYHIKHMYMYNRNVLVLVDTARRMLKVV
jgi:hypothetical protein